MAASKSIGSRKRGRPPKQDRQAEIREVFRWLRKDLIALWREKQRVEAKARWAKKRKAASLEYGRQRRSVVEARHKAPNPYSQVSIAARIGFEQSSLSDFERGGQLTGKNLENLKALIKAMRDEHREYVESAWEKQNPARPNARPRGRYADMNVPGESHPYYRRVFLEPLEDGQTLFRSLWLSDEREETDHSVPVVYCRNPDCRCPTRIDRGVYRMLRIEYEAFDPPWRPRKTPDGPSPRDQ